MQKNGKQFAGRDVQYKTWPDSVRFSLDIAGAYPPEAGIETWYRSIVMNRIAGTVSVQENYKLNSPAKETILSLMTPCDVAEAERGQLVLTMPQLAGGGTSKQIGILYDPAKLSPRVETIDVKDNQLKRVWGSTLRRVLLTATGNGESASWEVRFNRIAR
jgi:hypothetical protein